VRKETCLSWIEPRSGVHSFAAGVKSHLESEMVYMKFQKSLKQRKLG
jgi:hypothetical protein